VRQPRTGAALVRGLLLPLAVTALLLASQGTARAQQLDYTWTGLGADSQWTTAENWNPVGVPHPNLGDTQYTMAGTTRRDPTVSQIYVVKKITFNNTASPFTITNSSAFWVGDGGFVNNSPHTQTVNATINLFTSQTWDAAAGNMVFADVVMLFGSTKVLTVAGARDVTVTGNVTGEIAIVKQGGGTLLLSGSNNYVGGTTVEAGTLRVGTTLSLPQSTNYTVNGGTLDLNGSGLTATQLDGTGGTIDLGPGTLFVDQATDTTFAGAITGTGGLIKSGAGDLALTGANDYAGGTNVIAGMLTGNTNGLQGVIVNGADVVFDQSTDGTFAGAISGIGAVTKEGAGAVSFTGTNTYLGPTAVNAGALAVNGSITSATTVAALGTLAGSGTITGDVIVNGTTSAGNSIGTLNIVGAYSSTSGSVTEVEIGGAGTVPGVNNDLVAVTGAATIDGSVNVIAGQGTYAIGNQYTFLTGSTVSGTYSSITDDLAFFDAVLGYTAGSAYFTFVQGVSYADLATTLNTFNVGTYLDVVGPNATGDLEVLMDQLNQVSDADANFAMQQLSGAVYGTMGQVGVQNTSIYLQTLSRRLRSNLYDGDESASASHGSPMMASTINSGSGGDESLIIRGQGPETQWNSWATGFGIGGNADSDGNAAGIDASMGGMLVGMETGGGSHLLGFYGGYLGSSIGTDANESAKINGGTFGGYYVGHTDNQYLIAAGGFEFDEYETRRQIEFADLTAQGDGDGWKGYSYVERGMTFGARRLALQPFAAAQYVYNRQNGFTETGAAAANLDVLGINTHSLRSVVGSRLFGTGVSHSGRAVRPELRALWLHEFLETGNEFNTSFNEVGGALSFTVNGLGLGRDWALLGAGLNCDLGAGWIAYADYDVLVNDRQTFHVGAGGVQYAW
jgi:autotransporter-associated beta strand protein